MPTLQIHTVYFIMAKKINGYIFPDTIISNNVRVVLSNTGSGLLPDRYCFNPICWLSGSQCCQSTYYATSESLYLNMLVCWSTIFSFTIDIVCWYLVNPAAVFLYMFMFIKLINNLCLLFQLNT